MLKGQPLLDKKILVPRGKQQAKSFSQLVKKYGGIPIEIPLISFRPIQTRQNLEPILQKLDTYDWIIFTSNVTVETFMSFFDGGKPETFPKVAVIGERTKIVLEKKGIQVNFTPTEFVAETFAAEFLQQLEKDQRVLIPKGNLARDHIASEIRNYGAFADELVVYETFLPDESREMLSDHLNSENLDVLLFTSPSTVDHFMSVVEEQKLHDKLQRCIIGCIGPITHQKILSYGLSVAINPKVYTVEEMIKSTVIYFEDMYGG